MKFLDFPPCKNRFGCIQCRNDIKFVEHMKERFGEWDCPEGIAFGTPIEKMPQHIQTKISTYQARLQQQGRNVPQISQENKISPIRNMQPQITDFTQTPGCIHRMMCVECRNNAQFRERIQQQMGEWKCPENIPLNTPLEQMPENIKEVNRKREEQIRIQKETMDKIRIALDGIEEVIPEKALGLVDIIRVHIFPDTKKSTFCKYNTGEAKQVEQKCCGGKVKIVAGFVCSKHGDVSDQRCRGCQEFESKR